MATATTDRRREIYVGNSGSDRGQTIPWMLGSKLHDLRCERLWYLPLVPLSRSHMA
jgi:hypothetical protein